MRVAVAQDVDCLPIRKSVVRFPLDKNLNHELLWCLNQNVCVCKRCWIKAPGHRKALVWMCVCVRLGEWELWVLSWRRKVLFKYQSIYCLKTFQQANEKMTLLQSYKILWTCSWGTLTSPVLFPADFSAGNQRKTCWASTSCDTWCGWSWSWSVRSSSEITSTGTLGRAHLCRGWSVSCRSCLRTGSRS